MSLCANLVADLGGQQKANMRSGFSRTNAKGDVQVGEKTKRFKAFTREAFHRADGTQHFLGHIICLGHTVLTVFCDSLQHGKDYTREIMQKLTS